MEIAAGEEREELRRTVRSFISAVSPESEVRRLMETTDGYDPQVWLQLATELGLTGLAIPEEYDGAGGGFGEVAVVLEEMGGALMCAPYLSTAVLAAGALLRCDDEAARKDYLPAIAAGEILATVAVAEESGSWGPTAVGTTASRTASGWRLHGTKLFVLDGQVADLILVAARTGERGEVSLFAVDGKAPGLRRTAMATLDLTRRQTRLDMDGVPARLVAAEGGAGPVLEHLLHLGAVALACEQVGGAQRVLDMAVAYAKTRVQFGRLIGTFQAIKHRCADMALELDAARSAVAYGTWAAGSPDGADELPVAAAIAKIRCSEAYSFAAEENIQIHGGIGFTWEHPAHLYFRRAKSSEVMFGDPVHHRERLMRALIGTT